MSEKASAKYAEDLFRISDKDKSGLIDKLEFIRFRLLNQYSEALYYLANSEQETKQDREIFKLAIRKCVDESEQPNVQEILIIGEQFDIIC